MKRQTSITEKQNQIFDDGDEILTIKKDDKTSPIKKIIGQSCNVNNFF